MDMFLFHVQAENLPANLVVVNKPHPQCTPELDDDASNECCSRSVACASVSPNDKIGHGIYLIPTCHDLQSETALEHLRAAHVDLELSDLGAVLWESGSVRKRH